MKNKHIGFVALGVVIGVIVYVGFMNGGVRGEYPYHCADGTEFSITPSADFTSITVYPTKNAGVFLETKLPKVESNTGALYVGGGVVFFGKGETVHLITTALATSTACNPLPNKDSAPVNWGD